MLNVENKECLASDMFQMTPSERIKYLAKEKNVSLKEVALDLDIEQSTLLTWLAKKELPPLSKLNQIANYFDTSVRFITTGHHEINYRELENVDRKMMQNFHELSEVRKAEIREYVKILLNAEKSENQTFRIK